MCSILRTTYRFVGNPGFVDKAIFDNNYTCHPKYVKESSFNITIGKGESFITLCML